VVVVVEKDNEKDVAWVATLAEQVGKFSLQFINVLATGRC